MTSLHITNASIYGHSANELTLIDGKISAIGQAAPKDCKLIDAKGALLLPGIIDLYARAKNIQAESQAAAHGGISALCLSPDSKPMADTSADVKSILAAAGAGNGATVLPLGILTQELAGEQLSNMHSLIESGCLALSNARRPIKNALVLRRLMEYAATHDVTIFLTPQDEALSANGLMAEGPTATRLGLGGIPEAAETIALAQQIILAELTGCKIHISHISCARSVDMIRNAQQQGLAISADVAVANLWFTDHDVNGYNSQFYVQPPLRTENDRQALLNAVNEGILAISSNHNPVELADKKATFADAESGMGLLDCYLPMLTTLVERGEITLEGLVSGSSILPSKIMQYQSSLQEGERANFVLIDQQANRKLATAELISAGENNPMLGTALTGEVKLTLSNGRVSFNNTEIN